MYLVGDNLGASPLNSLNLAVSFPHFSKGGGAGGRGAGARNDPRLMNVNQSDGTFYVGDPYNTTCWSGKYKSTLFYYSTLLLLRKKFRISVLFLRSSRPAASPQPSKAASKRRQGESDYCTPKRHKRRGGHNTTFHQQKLVPP